MLSRVGHAVHTVADRPESDPTPLSRAVLTVSWGRRRRRITARGSGAKLGHYIGTGRIFAREHTTVRNDVRSNLLKHDPYILPSSAESVDRAIGDLLDESLALVEIAAPKQLNCDVRHDSS